MIIQHNIAAINSYRNLGVNQSGLNKNLEKLSSGYKINRANDAIGLIQTAEGALTEVHSMLQRMTTLATQAANGTYNSVARGNLQSEVDELLNEIDRIANYTDFNGIKPLADITKGNAGVMTFQIGPTSGEIIKVTGQPMTVFGIDAAIRGIKLSANMKNDLLGAIGKNGPEANKAFYIDQETGAIRLNKTEAGIKAALDAESKKEGTGSLKQEATDAFDEIAQLGTVSAANPNYSKPVKATAQFTFLTGMNVGSTMTTRSNQAIDTINAAINAVSSYRAKLGAAQNRLEHTINNLEVTSENITSAESRIRDTDMADEITQFTKNNILLQASQSMLAQSNSIPQSILSLLS